jgi:hypothetical protein
LAPFTKPERTAIFDVNPERLVIRGPDGEVVEERIDPRSSRGVKTARAGSA